MPKPDGHRPDAPIDWRRLHLWQIQPLRDLLGLAAVFALLFLGYQLSIVTVPLLLAILLAYLFEPLIVWITTRLKWVSRQGAAFGIILFTFLAVAVPVVVAAGFAGIQGVRYAQRLASDVDLLVKSVSTPEDKVLRKQVELQGKSWVSIRDYVVEQESIRRQTMADKKRAAEKAVNEENGTTQAPPSTPPVDPSATPSPGAEPLAASPEAQHHDEPSDIYNLTMAAIAWVRDNAALIGQRAIRGGEGAFRFAVGAFGSIGAFAFGAFLTAFFFFFVCTGWGKVIEFWRGLIPERKQGRVIELVQKMDRVIAGFVRGRLIICAIMMVVYTVGYTLIGVPAPLVVGPIVGLLVLVPYMAGIVGLPLAMILMALEPPSGWMSNWWWIVGSPFLVMAVQQTLDDYVLTPKIQGKTTNMDTPTILFASIAGGALAGVYGLLIAIPVAACVKILLIEVVWPRFRAWSQGQAADPLPIESN